MQSGIIYKHTNLINNKSYIGQSTKTMEERLKSHIKESKNKNTKSIFAKAINKYGIENFKSEVLEVLPLYSIIEEKQTIMDKREKYLIKKYKTLSSQNGYNISQGGNSPMLGRTHTSYSKQLISTNNKTQEDWDNMSEERYTNKCEAMSKPKSEEGRNNISISNRLRVQEENYINGFSGKYHSIEKKIEIVENRRNNNGGEYHPNGNRTAKTFKYISPTGEEFVIFNSSKKFCEEHNLQVKLFQKFKGIVIPEPKIVTDRTKSSRLSSVGWSRIEVI